MPGPLTLTVPDPSLILLVGPSGCGKSTFARRHFRPTEILSSDFFRGVVCDDEAEQAASGDAFDLLHAAANKRLAWGRLTAVDATNVRADRRRVLLDLARRYQFPTAAVVFNLPEELCQANNQNRPGRQVDPAVVRLHLEQLRQSLPALGEEGYRAVCVLSSPEEVQSAVVERRRHVGPA